MLDRFIPLDRWLSQPDHDAVPSTVSPHASADAAASDGAQCDIGAAVENPCDADILADVGAQARRFRAALADAVDVALDDLLRDIACHVLARELTTTPADVAAIARSALERYAADGPLHVRAHPDECAAIAELGIPVVADRHLARGDVTLHLRSGTIDARLPARLHVLLAER